MFNFKARNYKDTEIHKVIQQFGNEYQIRNINEQKQTNETRIRTANFSTSH
jgi:hypothetical protein